MSSIGLVLVVEEINQGHVIDRDPPTAVRAELVRRDPVDCMNLGGGGALRPPFPRERAMS